jgi:hypothetical protein
MAFPLVSGLGHAHHHHTAHTTGALAASVSEQSAQRNLVQWKGATHVLLRPSEVLVHGIGAHST